MVERPIKKSERQSAPADDTPKSDDTPKNSEAKPAPSAPKRSDRGEKRSSGKGKRGTQEDEPKQVVNLALMRGPKPVKAPAPVTPPSEPEAVSEAEPQTELIAE